MVYSILVHNTYNTCIFRYAFTPLLDAPDDDRDETELFIKEAYNGNIFVYYFIL